VARDIDGACDIKHPPALSDLAPPDASDLLARPTRRDLLPKGAMASGSITLDPVAAHVTVLAVACSRCDRAGWYHLDALIARHGAGFGIPELLRLLSDDCPKRKSISAYDLCGVHCPELPTFFRT
jgi:hypothetical protein